MGCTSGSYRCLRQRLVSEATSPRRLSVPGVHLLRLAFQTSKALVPLSGLEQQGVHHLCLSVRDSPQACERGARKLEGHP